MADHESFDQYLLERLRSPEVARAFIEGALEDYDNDGDSGALLMSLRRVAEARGLDAESGQADPADPLKSLARLLHLLGYRLSASPVE